MAGDVRGEHRSSRRLPGRLRHLSLRLALAACRPSQMRKHTIQTPSASRTQPLRAASYARACCDDGPRIRVSGFVVMLGTVGEGRTGRGGRVRGSRCPFECRFLAGLPRFRAQAVMFDLYDAKDCSTPGGLQAVLVGLAGKPWRLRFLPLWFPKNSVRLQNQ
jgi:hypothetical protein